LSDKEQFIRLLKEFRDFKEETAKIISGLRKEIQELKDKLAKYENPKNSNNSSIPPSQDPNRVTRTLRKKSGKKVGGQKGHKGYKLLKVAHPDKIVLHNITQCDCCGAHLPEEGKITSKQVFDIPVIKMEVTEHQIMIKTCTNCGKQNKSSFPKGLVQEAQYGNNIKAFAIYLQNYHMLPFARCSELIKDLTGHKISVGSLANFQGVGYEKLENFENEIKKRLLQKPVLHADETGIRQSGKQHWMHVLSSHSMSYFGYHAKRGKEAINDFGLIPLYKGTLVHDRFSTYFSYSCKHSLCNAHILRELLYLWESKKLKWARNLSNLLSGVHHNIKQGKIYSPEEYQRTLNCFEKIIAPTLKNYNPIYTKTKEEKLAFALEKHKHLFLKFIREKEVPFDNNQAERDLRIACPAFIAGIKVKQKVSGCFREPAYAQYFARIRSYISTLKKNQENILLNMQYSFQGKAFLTDAAE